MQPFWLKICDSFNWHIFFCYLKIYLIKRKTYNVIISLAKQKLKGNPSIQDLPILQKEQDNSDSYDYAKVELPFIEVSSQHFPEERGHAGYSFF